MEKWGGEPLICVNVISGTPERAANWVEYVNGSQQTRYGKLRARNGHPEPYGVRYWELDNETQRRFSAEQYAEQVPSVFGGDEGRGSGRAIVGGRLFVDRR